MCAVNSIGDLVFDRDFSSMAGSWMHLAVTMDTSASTKIFKLYVNGSLDQTISVTGTLGTINYNTATAGGWSNDRFLSGSMSDLRVWNTVRSDAQLSNSAANVLSLSGSEADLLRWYKLNEGVGTTIIDSSNHYNTTASGSPTW